MIFFSFCFFKVKPVSTTKTSLVAKTHSQLVGGLEFEYPSPCKIRLGFDMFLGPEPNPNLTCCHSYSLSIRKFLFPWKFFHGTSCLTIYFPFYNGSKNQLPPKILILQSTVPSKKVSQTIQFYSFLNQSSAHLISFFAVEKLKKFILIFGWYS